MSRPPKGSDAAYEVGYGRPPKHTRFKKGQSGNPKGRPKGAKNLRTVLEKVSSEPIRVREGEATRTMAKLEAVVVQVFNRAMKGDVRAANMLAVLLGRAGLIGTPEPATEEARLSPAEEAIFAEYFGSSGPSEPET